ncbi:hypothetical protein [Tumebacillus lipolyticus]
MSMSQPDMMNVEDSLPDYEVLLKAMAEAKDGTTNKWDIICSYHVDKLNEVLADHYGKSKLISQFTFSNEEVDRFTRETYISTYELSFAAPTIEFLSQNGLCQLKLPLVKGRNMVRKEDGKLLTEYDLPENQYRLLAIVSLAAIVGDDAEGMKKSGQVVQFREDGQQANVFLHFKSELGTSFKIDPEPKKEDKSDLAVIVREINSYFNQYVDELEWSLTSLNNDSVGENRFTIVPKKFVFSTSQAEQSGPGILSLFIATENSGGEGGKANSSFDLGDGTLQPIPKGYTASLILSHEFVARVYLQQALSKIGFRSIAEDISVETGAVTTAHFDKTVNAKWGNVFDFAEDITVDALKLDLGGKPFRFAFSTDSLQVEMEQRTEVKWTRFTIGGHGGHYSDGKAKVKVALDKTYLLREIVTLNDEEITLSFRTENEDYKVSVEGFPSGSFGGDSKAVRFVQKQVYSNLPEISFDLEAINYFRATNLLMPGKKVIAFDHQAGIHVPRDLILVGHIVEVSNG